MSTSNFIKSWQGHTGLNHTPAYQVSGVPFASGNINATSGPIRVEFPSLTRWVQVHNAGAGSLKVGFSSYGVDGTSGDFYFRLPASSSSGILELKASELYLDGGTSGQVSVVAGLTRILTSSVTLDKGANWSGSSGVG